MYVLHYSPSTASLVIHWMLIELDQPHELRRVDLAANEHKTAAYLALNPSGVVPTLVIDGAPVCEAAAIALHLADVHAEANLAPPVGTLARARYYQWMFFMANTLQPAYRAWFYPDEPAGAAHAAHAKAQARARIEAAWQQVEAQLAHGGPYLLGEQLTAVDFMTTMLMRWSRNMPTPAHTHPRLGAYAQRMKARPAFREVYRREGLTDWT
ncbi:MAG: glutathione S-transferase family protein [Deltaproteobacteria bacterium]|nr:glutathione S-transferase family protein [Deltaproteobacteria bacterium]